MDLKTLSDILGWTYFICWASSFYPQIYENWKLKNVSGLSADYVSLNLTGYICVCIYSTAGFINNQLDIGTVLISDLFYCYHNLAMTCIIVGQMLYYPRGENKISKVIVIMLVILWVYTPIYTIITFSWVDVPVEYNAYKMMGYNKVAISLIKYIPQVYMNCIRRSTEGWGIWVSLLDLAGGILSGIGSIIDSIDTGENLNIVKFLLGTLTLVFDIILIVQHYCLFPPKKNTLLQVEDTDISLQKS